MDKVISDSLSAKSKIFLPLILFLGCTTGQTRIAKKVEWVASVKNNMHKCVFESVKVDAAGDAYAVGHQEETAAIDYGNGVTLKGNYAGQNSVLVKYSTNGATLWARTPLKGNLSSNFNDVAIDKEGHLYVAGIQFGNGYFDYGNNVRVQGAHSVASPVIIKYDRDGRALWAKSSLSGGSSATFEAIVTDNSGNIYVIGYQSGTNRHAYSKSVILKGSSEDMNSIILKFDSAGDLKWGKTIAGEARDSRFLKASTDLAGNILVVGFQDGTGLVDYGDNVRLKGVGSESSGVLIKYTADGKTLWATSHPVESQRTHFSSVVTDADGYIYVTASAVNHKTYSIEAKGKSYNMLSTDSRIALMKFDTAGNIVWQSEPQRKKAITSFKGIAIHKNHIYVVGDQKGGLENDYGNGVKLREPGSVHHSLVLKYDLSGSAVRGELVRVKTKVKNKTSRTTGMHFQSVAVDPGDNLVIVGSQAGESEYAYSEDLTSRGSGPGYSPVIVKYVQ